MCTATKQLSRFFQILNHHQYVAKIQKAQGAHELSTAKLEVVLVGFTGSIRNSSQLCEVSQDESLTENLWIKNTSQNYVNYIVPAWQTAHNYFCITKLAHAFISTVHRKNKPKKPRSNILNEIFPKKVSWRFSGSLTCYKYAYDKIAGKLKASKV